MKNLNLSNLSQIFLALVIGITLSNELLGEFFMVFPSLGFLRLLGSVTIHISKKKFEIVNEKMKTFDYCSNFLRFRVSNNSCLKFSFFH